MQFFKNILQNEELRMQLACIAVSGAALLASMLDIRPLPFDLAWLAVILCGVPIVWGALKGLVTEFDIKADVLVSIALIASLTIGEDFAAGEIAFIMQLGSLLEEATLARARAGIEKLVRLSPRTARRIVDGKEEIIRAEDVRKGDILRVLPGETIPADGVITMGETSVNQAVMTGEPLPVDKTAGDEVASGTVNQFGSFEMRALKVGEDSSIQRMIRLVQSARCRQGKNCVLGRPMGYMDCGNGAYNGGSNRLYYRRSNTCGNGACSVLPLCFGAGNADGGYGCHWQRGAPRIFGARRRCA